MCLSIRRAGNVSDRSLVYANSCSPVLPDDDLGKSVESAVAGECITDLLSPIRIIHVPAVDHVLIGTHRFHSIGDARTRIFFLTFATEPLDIEAWRQQVWIVRARAPFADRVSQPREASYRFGRVPPLPQVRRRVPKRVASIRPKRHTEIRIQKIGEAS